MIDGTNSQIWDRAPLAVLVEEAGGRYRDRFGGRDLHLPGGFFTNGHIDPALDAHLADENRIAPVRLVVTRSWVDRTATRRRTA